MRTAASIAVFSAFMLVLSFGVPLSALAQDATGTDASSTSQGFVSLTQLPQISQAADTNSLPLFLNSLYKICIGVGAVLAVLMIMYAGFLFMTSRGSVASNEKAKSYIQNAVLGLILLLSPTIVFSIINPDILKLDLNFDSLRLNDDDLVEVNPNTTAESARICTTISGEGKTKIAEIKPGQDAASACSALGKGWAHYPECGSVEEGHAYCGYDPKNDQNNPEPPSPESESGKYTYDWYLRQKDFSDKDGGYCLMSHTSHFETQQACTSALSSAKTSADDLFAASDNCNGSTGQITPKNVYDQISGLHVCQE